MRSSSWITLIVLLLAGAILLLGRCTPGSDAEDLTFLNLEDSVGYVGMQTCRSCHASIYDSYIRTGMGRSWGRATPDRSDASFGPHALVYDSASNYFYAPFFVDTILYVREFRMEGKDTVHNRVEKVDYIVGSGHHTNSHITSRNGYIYQVPITFYTQEKRWDLAPGFEDGANSRFSRILNTECVTCHNHYPEHVQGSENKFFKMPEGIECERCHGPGALHVKTKLAGEIIDTSRYADRTIVNPRRLSRDRVTDLCQRCHLQGIAVLQPGQTFFDFKPGMKLSDVMNVFLPRYTDSDERFIMASQADRLRLSQCYQKSETLTCITCHHPHISVKETGRQQYNQPCLNCHQPTGKLTCTAPLADRAARGDDCAACHMPPSGSIDIPHVRITDHYIRRDYTRKSSENKPKGSFLGLELLTKTTGTPLEMAEGYLALYDKFVADPAMLDSAEAWLNRDHSGEIERGMRSIVHLHFARQRYSALSGLADSRDTAGLDGWTAYRIGEGCLNMRRPQRAATFLKRAVSQEAHNLEFREKYGLALGMLGQIPAARREFLWVLKEDPARPLALTNLGYLHAISGDLTAAEAYYRQALKWDPDFGQAKENLNALLAVKK
ncbi:MAG: tetratricopeptide repeat protein [Lewinellaceae bacterium]|nr:tetratricopeptide repeat protein [Saprospiraceae bacterium]MCB9313579.1 tetratricopeptide repeat protein [Lewinellaceae bacterium]HRW74356.1 tetratricopeptide repeat protein [Saprospiraceae bacterium]